MFVHWYWILWRNMKRVKNMTWKYEWRWKRNAKFCCQIGGLFPKLFWTAILNLKDFSNANLQQKCRVLRNFCVRDISSKVSELVSALFCTFSCLTYGAANMLDNRYWILWQNMKESKKGMQIFDGRKGLFPKLFWQQSEFWSLLLCSGYFSKYQIFSKLFLEQQYWVLRTFVVFSRKYLKLRVLSLMCDESLYRMDYNALPLQNIKKFIQYVCWNKNIVILLRRKVGDFNPWKSWRESISDKFVSSVTRGFPIRVFCLKTSPQIFGTGGGFGSDIVCIVGSLLRVT